MTRSILACITLMAVAGCAANYPYYSEKAYEGAVRAALESRIKEDLGTAPVHKYRDLVIAFSVCRDGDVMDYRLIGGNRLSRQYVRKLLLSRSFPAHSFSKGAFIRLPIQFRESEDH